MGRKVHPLGFRIGTVRDWQAKWYADKHYPEFLHEDMQIRNAIGSKYTDAGVSLVEIERQAHKVAVSIYTARPGIVIGRGGQRVDEVKNYLESLIDKKVQLNIQEIRQPEMDAFLVARMVAEQIERRIAYRRAMKQALFRTMQAGAQGMKISCSGRLGGVEIARRQTMHRGRVPLHTLRADVDYGFTEARTTLGRIGIKVWIYRGDILPEVEETIGEEIAAETAAPATEEKAPAAEKEEVKAAAEAPAEAKVEIEAEAKAEEKKPEAKAEVKEEKPAKPRATKKKAGPEAEAPAEEPEAKAEVKEEKPARPRATKKKAEAEAETEDKKETKARKTTKAAKDEKEAAPEADIATEETDATTEEG
jgi:small subunit ribosomal protein S3